MLLFTAEPQRKLSYLFFLFSFERKENKKQKPYGNIILFSIKCFWLSYNIFGILHNVDLFLFFLLSYCENL